MGDTYYVDPAADGNDDGSTWTHAWEDVQDAFDNAEADDTVLCRGTQTLGAIIDVDTNSGDPGAGEPIRFIGCNAGGTVDGTRFVLDGDSAVANCLLFDDEDGYVIENFEFDSATDDNVGTADNDHPKYHTFMNCISHDAGGTGDGWGRNTAKTFYDSQWIDCRAYNNGGVGWADPSRCNLALCSAIGNTSHGFNLGLGTIGHALIVHGNGGVGVRATSYVCGVAYSVIDGNGDDGVYTGFGPMTVLGCRITNNGGYGIRAAGSLIFDLWNCFYNNTSGRTNGSLIISAHKGSNTYLEAASGTEGYQDRGNDKFNLVPGALGYRAEVDLDGGSNYARFGMGLPTIIKRHPGVARV